MTKSGLWEAIGGIAYLPARRCLDRDLLPRFKFCWRGNPEKVINERFISIGSLASGSADVRNRPGDPLYLEVGRKFPVWSKREPNITGVDKVRVPVLGMGKLD